MRVNIGILAYLIFCSFLCCGSASPVDTDENDDNIEQVLELLAEHGLKRNDQPFTGDHDSRIVGGDDATPGDNPWMVSLYVVKTIFLCGGSIIDKRTILTAAHCVDFLPDYITVTVRAGDYLMQEKDEHEQRVNVKRMIIHPRYNAKRAKFDLAILKLESGLKFNEYVQPIAIPAPWKERYLVNRKNCKVIGFGTVDYPEVEYPLVLQEANSTLRSGMFCKSHLADRNAVPPFNPTYQICSYDENFGACYGDSGGPFVCYDVNDVPFQVGISSWGSRDCWDGFNVFGRVAKFASWIQEQRS